MFQALLREHWFKDIKTRRSLQTEALYACLPERSDQPAVVHQGLVKSLQQLAQLGVAGLAVADRG